MTKPRQESKIIKFFKKNENRLTKEQKNKNEEKIREGD